MVEIPGREFTMGSNRFYPEESPARRVQVSSFWIDETPVTNRQFAEFVTASGYVTEAETPPDPRQYPGMHASMARAGSIVFTPQPGLSLQNPMSWWSFKFGADWRHPEGEGSSIDGLHDHPVVHVTFSDAQAYAEWAGKELPTEAQWESAAKGAVDDWEFAWGHDLAPGGKMMCNFWQGQFPSENLVFDGFERTSPVRTFAPNHFGVFDMIGNVWEWTRDWYADAGELARQKEGCCVPKDPKGGTEAAGRSPQLHELAPRKVLKGGSHLCAENYCQRYRPAARIPQTVETSTSHIGFRCIAR